MLPFLLSKWTVMGGSHRQPDRKEWARATARRGAKRLSPRRKALHIFITPNVDLFAKFSIEKTKAGVVSLLPKLALGTFASKMPAADMDKTRVRSLYAAHLLSWTALIMVIVWAVAYQVPGRERVTTTYRTAVMYHGIPYFSMHSSVRHHWKDQVESSARLLLCASTLFRLPGKRMISLEKASSGAHHQLEIRSEWLGQG